MVKSKLESYSPACTMVEEQKEKCITTSFAPFWKHAFGSCKTRITSFSELVLLNLHL